MKNNMIKHVATSISVPSDEAKRLEALQYYDVLDSLPEPDFDDLTQLAANICATPVALITLLDSKRQWFKSAVGIDRMETPREMAFCQQTILGDGLLEIADTLENSDFVNNPLVTNEPHIRFYAGAPLITPEGYRLGSLCVLDVVPRRLTPLQRSTLQILSRQVVAQLELRKHERQLAKHNFHLESFHTFFRNTREIMAIVDAEHLTIAEINNAFYRISGYTQEEITQKQLLYFISDEDLLETVVALKQAQKKGTEVKDRDSRLVCKDGSLKWISWSGILKSGKWYINGRDITDRKRIETELLKAKEQAEKSMKAKGQFLSNMSHEIRTPMNAVIGITNLLLQDQPRPDQIEYLKTLKFSSENLLVLINDILDFSKMEAGKVTMESIDFNLKELMYGIRQSLMLKAEEKNIKLKTRLDAALPEVLVGDPARLNQILINLIGNAIKFTDKGTVEVCLKVKRQTPAEVVIDFEVSDTGIGIPADKLPTIFDSFTQAHSDTSRTHGGSGLGLAITRQLLELHNSQIGVRSEEGKGSRFFFDLTFRKSTRKWPTSLSQEAAAPRKELQNVRLLLVEDNEVNRMVVTKFLSKWGVQITHAANGLIALEKIRDRQYDMVLMDLQMPEMDGYSATKAIRAMEDPYYKNVPIIALTASAMLDVKDQVFLVGMNDYLTKPFDPKDFYNKIEKYAPKPADALHETDLVKLLPRVSGQVEHVIGTEPIDTDIAQHITQMCIETLEDLINQYQAHLLTGNLAKLKWMIHHTQAILQSLELDPIIEEVKHGEEMLTGDKRPESMLLASIEQVRHLCGVAIEDLKEKIQKMAAA